MRSIPRETIKKRKMVYQTPDEEEIYMMVGQGVEGGENKDCSICHNLSATCGQKLIFIGPRCHWGPIYGSGPMSVTPSKTICRLN